MIVAPAEIVPPDNPVYTTSVLLTCSKSKKSSFILWEESYNSVGVIEDLEMSSTITLGFVMLTRRSNSNPKNVEPGLITNSSTTSFVAGSSYGAINVIWPAILDLAE